MGVDGLFRASWPGRGPGRTGRGAARGAGFTRGCPVAFRDEPAFRGGHQSRCRTVSSIPEARQPAGARRVWAALGPSGGGACSRSCLTSPHCCTPPWTIEPPSLWGSGWRQIGSPPASRRKSALFSRWGGAALLLWRQPPPGAGCARPGGSGCGQQRARNGDCQRAVSGTLAIRAGEMLPQDPSNIRVRPKCAPAGACGAQHKVVSADCQGHGKGYSAAASCSAAAAAAAAAAATAAMVSPAVPRGGPFRAVQIFAVARLRRPGRLALSAAPSFPSRRSTRRHPAHPLERVASARIRPPLPARAQRPSQGCAGSLCTLDQLRHGEFSILCACQRQHP